MKEITIEIHNEEKKGNWAEVYFGDEIATIVNEIAKANQLIGIKPRRK